MIKKKKFQQPSGSAILGTQKTSKEPNPLDLLDQLLIRVGMQTKPGEAESYANNPPEFKLDLEKDEDF